MIGWRLDRGKPVHLYRECVPVRTQPKLALVQLVKTVHGEYRIFDDLTRQPVTTRMCGRCLLSANAP